MEQKGEEGQTCCVTAVICMFSCPQALVLPIFGSLDPTEYHHWLSSASILQKADWDPVSLRHCMSQSLRIPPCKSVSLIASVSQETTDSFINPLSNSQ